jgi:hypothetical protein
VLHRIGGEMRRGEEGTLASRYSSGILTLMASVNADGFMSEHELPAV